MRCVLALGVGCVGRAFRMSFKRTLVSLPRMQENSSISLNTAKGFIYSQQSYGFHQKDHTLEFLEPAEWLNFSFSPFV